MTQAGYLDGLKLPSLDKPRVSVPRAPQDLGRAGRVLWRQAWTSGKLNMERDRPLIEEASRLADTLAALRVDIKEHGPILVEAVQSARGELVGEKRVANPAVELARKTSAQMVSILMQLALSSLATKMAAPVRDRFGNVEDE